MFVVKKNFMYNFAVLPVPTHSTDNFTQAGTAHAVFHALRKRWMGMGSERASGLGCVVGDLKQGKEGKEGTMMPSASASGNCNNGLDDQAGGHKAAW